MKKGHVNLHCAKTGPDPLAYECLQRIRECLGHWEFYQGHADFMAEMLREGRTVVIRTQPTFTYDVK
jgi:hypothetical protein